jgi:hypothetical protein
MSSVTTRAVTLVCLLAVLGWAQLEQVDALRQQGF